MRKAKQKAGKKFAYPIGNIYFSSCTHCIFLLQAFFAVIIILFFVKSQ